MTRIVFVILGVLAVAACEPGAGGGYSSGGSTYSTSDY